MTIRDADYGDIPAIRAIYAPYVLHTAVSFEREVPTVEEFHRRMESTLARFPYLVAEEDGRVLGYCYAGCVNERPSAWPSAELSVYVEQEQRGRGIGRRLYTAMEERLKAQNVRNLYALVAEAVGENPYLTADSPRFHTAMGYREVGRLHKCGEKFGYWLDLTYWEKGIGES